MIKQVLLYSTDGCHLCEDALKLCKSLELSPTVIDIVEDDDLVHLYGEHIPVLLVEREEQALFWPFDAEQIKQYLKYYGIS
jgi:glutaredoxin